LGNISYQFVGQRTDLVYDDATFSTVQKELASYHWVDVSLNFQVNSKIRIYGMIKNALNQMIVEQYGYKGMPVVISGGVELVI
jgi:outer membrane cobalamin receptor